MTIKELINEWLYENHKYEIKRRTLLRYETIINNHILNECGDVDINNVTSRDLQHYVNIVKNKISDYTHRPLSSSTINTVITVFKESFNYALDYEILTYNPALKLKRVSDKKDEKVKAFTKEEQIKLERYLSSDNRIENFVYILSLYTGIRLGEAMALTFKDIDFRSGVMNINKTKYKTKDENGKWVYYIDKPKTQKSVREIPLPSFLKEELKRLKNLKLSKKVVFKSDGGELNDKTVVWRLAHILKKIKVRRLSFHSLRHTFATRALENKMDIKTLSEILGHTNISTTLNVYTHSLIEHKKNQMRKIKKLV